MPIDLVQRIPSSLGPLYPRLYTVAMMLFRSRDNVKEKADREKVGFKGASSNRRIRETMDLVTMSSRDSVFH